MKRFVSMLLVILVSIATFAQKEEARPTVDTEIVRKCSSIDIEGDVYENVLVTIKANKPDYFGRINSK